MQLTAHMTRQAERLLTRITKPANTPWADRKAELLRAWNTLEELERHLLCLHLEVHDGAQFILAMTERLGAEAQAKRARDFALAGLRQ